MPDPPRSLALLCGINDYANVSDLRGCLHDVAAMSALLAGPYGFDPAGIVTLLDADATRANILDGLHRLSADARPGDRIAFFNAGHGTQVFSKDRREPDHLDEAICPWGAIPDDPATLILDGTLGEWILSLRAGVKAAVILDTCHSGDGTRDIRPRPSAPPGAHPRAVEWSSLERCCGCGAADPATCRCKCHWHPDDRGTDLARYAPPDISVERAAAERRVPTRRITRNPREGWPPPGIVVVAACEPWETAADAWIPAAGEYRGAFSEALGRLLTARPGIGRGELQRRLRTGLARGGFRQVPQLTAAQGERGGIFGVARRGGVPSV